MSEAPAGQHDTGANLLLTAEHLGFAYPGVPVLHDLSFTIRPGLTLLRGGDGRGKSTLLRLMAGALQPTAGVLRRPAAAVFFVHPADPAHDPITAQAWLAARQAEATAWHAGVASRLIGAFGLAEHIDKPMFMLSTGSRRKVGLVAAAASGAPLTLLDMPFAALDAASGRVLLQLLAEAAADADRGWVLADHELPAGLGGVPLSGLVDLGD